LFIEGIPDLSYCAVVVMNAGAVAASLSARGGTLLRNIDSPAER